jgi:hypothetical protein
MTTAAAPARSTGSAAPPAFADEHTLRAVRPEVRALLESSPAFQEMTPEERNRVAGLMVKVAAYMVNPDGTTTEHMGADTAATHAGAPPLATAQADPVTGVESRLAKAPGSTGKDFEAGAVKQGVEQFGELVKKVDFPAFVAGLINGVFKAIVDTSIQQMRAYGELLSNVAKTVDQFAQDNISENNSRDWLAQKYPDDLAVSTDSMDSGMAADGDGQAPPQPRLVATGEDSEEALKRISADLGLEKPITDLSDEDQERQLVIRARLQMARSRQQMLASMVMLGINRIVVTDGLIHAKVVFDMKASDQAKRVARASMYDKKEDTSASSLSVGFSSWFSPVSAGYNSEQSSDHVTTVQSSVDDTSESKAQVKANLTGEVRVNFKSDYFPMDKLANPQMIAAIQGNAQPAEPPGSAAHPPATTPATSPAPAAHP